MPAITTDRVREQYTKNAAQLRGMLEQARAVAPKKHRGYTVEQLEQRVWLYEHFAAGLPLPPQDALLAFPLKGARLAKFEGDKANGWR